MPLFRPRRRKDHTDMRQPPPPSSEGAGWYVFEHLVNLAIKDPSAVGRMTAHQQHIYALNLVRQEVASGGFDGYFRWTKGASAPIALEGFDLVAPAMGMILREALSLRQKDDDPDFEPLDGLFNLAEFRLQVDPLVDSYVAEHSAGFYK